jgi:hypothetical protein
MIGTFVRMIKPVFFALPILLAGCLTTQTLNTSDGATIYTVTCSDFSHSNIAGCQRKANQLCKNGFKVHHDLSYQIVRPDSGDGFYLPPRDYLAVECKQA